MGHMNVQYYVAAFDQAMWHLMLSLGYCPSWTADREQGWVDVNYVINFRHELRAGALFHVDSAILKVGATSLTSGHRLIDSEHAVVAAEIEMKSVYFDLRKRCSLALPRAIRDAAESRCA
jgi:acyl-CoA thioester hydrolase